MVMADREGVKTASLPVTALTMVGLADNVLNGLARVPFGRFWRGPAGLLDNVGQSVTRQAVRSFMGYSMGLPIEEFRSMEKVLDDICGMVMPPVIGLAGKVEITTDEINGIPGVWVRAKSSDDAGPDDTADTDTADTADTDTAGNGSRGVRGTVLYLHGGGYIGTSPMMYAAFAAALVRISHCEIFIADYRMAPEFPFPAGMHDAAAVYRGLLGRGITADQLIVAGDSGGGGLAASLIAHLHDEGLAKPAAVALFSPEIDLNLDHDSVVENAPHDILPWSIPTAPYLHGVAPGDGRVSVLNADPDPEWFPPTFVCWGEHEMFRDSIRDFAAGLRTAGVRVTAIEERGMFHVFPILMPWAESTKRVLQSLRRLAETYASPERRSPASGADQA